MADYALHRLSFVIGADHPALAGHFPGNPIVPGVVLLDRVIEAAESWLNAPLAVKTVGQVKFLTPLLPDQPASIELRHRPDELRFVIRCEAQALAPVIAQGTFTLRLPQ
jgi:3-hydroxyacyl-[acyl-carrier-protein] dehydratase